MALQEDSQAPIPGEITSILSLIKSAAISKAVAKIHPHLWEIPISELEQHLQPSDSAKAIKLALWNELGNAMLTGQAVKISRVATQAQLSHDYSHELLTRDPAQLVWMLRPSHHQLGPEQIMADVLEKVGEITRLPTKDARGRPIVRNAKLVMHALQVLWPLLKP